MQLAETSLSDSGVKGHAPRAIVVIGAGTGGPSALSRILPKIPSDFPGAIIVVQHMRPGFTGLLAKHLNEICELSVAEAEDGHPLAGGAALITPGDCKIAVQPMGEDSEHQFSTSLETVGSSIDAARLRVDDAMLSAVDAMGARTIGVVLTGCGDDGSAGMKAIRAKGGKTLVQDESSSAVFDMPRAAIDSGVVDEVLPLWSLADRINEIVRAF